jgi:hypothetical protein
MMWTSPSTQIHSSETQIISDTAVKILNLTLYGFICYCHLNKIVEIWLIINLCHTACKDILILLMPMWQNINLFGRTARIYVCVCVRACVWGGGGIQWSDTGKNIRGDHLYQSAASFCSLIYCMLHQQENFLNETKNALKICWMS